MKQVLGIYDIPNIQHRVDDERRNTQPLDDATASDKGCI